MHLGAFLYGPVREAKVIYEAGNVSAHSIVKQTFAEDNTVTIDRFRN